MEEIFRYRRSADVEELYQTISYFRYFHVLKMSMVVTCPLADSICGYNVPGLLVPFFELWSHKVGESNGRYFPCLENRPELTKRGDVSRQDKLFVHESLKGGQLQTLSRIYTKY